MALFLRGELGRLRTGGVGRCGPEEALSVWNHWRKRGGPGRHGVRVVCRGGGHFRAVRAVGGETRRVREVSVHVAEAERLGEQANGGELADAARLEG